METLLKQFDSFLKRSMLPSSVLILFLVIFFYNQVIDILGNFSSISENYLFIAIFLGIIFLIAVSFIISIIVQMIFDNTLKKNFNSSLLYPHENIRLIKLRNRAISKLKKESENFDDMELNDYFLYQVLGRKLKFLEYSTSTTRYIDETKSAGSIYIAISTALIIQSFINFLIIYPFTIIGLYFFIRSYIKSKYRSRAIRIYTNYLIWDNK